jgi:predicted  nucleic acid-binding Zn-ribbon protein
MKKHIRIITAVSKLRAEIAERNAEADELEETLTSARTDIETLKGLMSKLESQAADKGLAVSDLHKAVDEFKPAARVKKTSK